MSPDFTSIARRIHDWIRDGNPPLAIDPEAAFQALAREVFKAQYHSVPAFQSWCRSLHLTPADDPPWFRIPAVPTEAFKEFELSAIPAGQRTVEFRSSGTTGQRPSRHHHGPESLELYTASALAGVRRHLLPETAGIRPDTNLPVTSPVVLSLTPPPARVPHSSLVHMFGAIVGSGGHPGSCFAGLLGDDGSWEIDFGRITAFLRDRQAANQPVCILGTAFNVVHLLEAMETAGTRFLLPPGSRLLETGGYKGRSRELPRLALHAAAGAALGLPPAAIVTEYGMSELGSQGYDRTVSSDPTLPPCPPIFRFPEWARARVVSPDTGNEVGDGQTGIVEIFDLANLWSVAHVRTADAAIRRGPHFELLGRAAQAEPRGCSRQSS